MRKVTSTTDLPCSIDKFWEVFFDEAYNRAFYLEEMGFPELKILEQTDSSRRIRAIPKLDMPKPVMKVLGDRFAYEEDGSLDRATNTWRWKMIPSTLPDKLLTSGVIRVEAQGDGIRRFDEATLEAKIFGVGKLIESSTEKEVRGAWEKEAAFLRRWLKDH